MVQLSILATRTNTTERNTASNSFEDPLSFMDIVQRGGEEGNEDARLDD
jgi:hypothetical protein